MMDVYVGVTEPFAALRRDARETRMTLDPVDLRGDAACDGSRVSGSRADVEDVVIVLELQRLQHQRNDVRLRNRLFLIDRQRGILVSELDQFMRHELLARHLGHGAEDVLVANAAGDELAFDHFLLSGSTGRAGSHTSHTPYAGWTAA